MKLTNLLICLVMAGCAAAPAKTRHVTAPVKAPSTERVVKDIRDAKDSVGRAQVASRRVGDIGTRIENKATVILENFR